MKKLIVLPLCLPLLWPVWAGATDVTAGTDLTGVFNASGSYELQDGTHTISANFTTAADVVVTATDGATLVIDPGVVFEFRDGFELNGARVEMGSGARLETEAESGDTHVDGATITGNTFAADADAANQPLINIKQGFASYSRNIAITDNLFESVGVYMDTGDAVTITGNRFTGLGTEFTAIRAWGSNHRIERNFIDSGEVGISLQGRHDIAAFRRQCTGNVIASNIVLNTAEEGISFDALANNGNWTVLREYDTVSAAGGSSVVTLASGNWSAETPQTTYNNSRYHMVFLSGALAGNYYLITTHSGANFTLDIPGGDYSSISGGDAVSVQMVCYENTIAGNFVVPKLYGHRANTTGITLHGIGHDNDVYNNVVAGYSDGVGQGELGWTNFAIREASLNSVSSTGSITGQARRGAVGANRIVSNRDLGGGIGDDYKNYGGAPDYTPPASTYTGNSEITRAAAKLVGGSNPTTAEGFRLKVDSPLRAAGTTLGPYQDYGNRRFKYPPSIGAWEYASGDTADARTIAAPRTLRE